MGMAAADSQFHVLAVDDSIIDRKLIEKLLKTSSYHVTTVESGSKALEFLGLCEDEDQSNPNQPSIFPKNHREVEVNLVITDYCMPGMTGYDLLKKIKESSSLRDIPVVIMSSEDVPSRITRCLEEGAEDFFLKPVTASDVNKLRPHMMKTKCKNHQNAERLEMVEHQESLEPETPEKQQNQEPSDVSEIHLQAKQQLQQQTQANNGKRKSMEEGLSPDRTRPRYNDLLVSN